MSKSTFYDHNQVEANWQKVWEDLQFFQGTANLVDPSTSHSSPKASKGESLRMTDREKMYLLFAFAYPSGSGLHVGHVESKTALDILARYYRMNGKDVFFPVGWDAFGLPAENYAIKTGVPPVETTKNAIDTFRRQLKRIGISYDWAGEIATCHPGYYKWTQWIFAQLFNKGLAYQSMGKVNWCPSCQTVLANEQVVNGHCERCDDEVIQKEMKQWYFKITDYKDELISGLDQVDWPAPTKSQQLNWIGRSEGVEVNFQVKESEQKITCFTTRIDTIFGVTFLVISPEKFLKFKLEKIQSEEDSKKTKEYIDKAFKKTEEERQIGQKDKTGIDTGLVAVNPVNDEEIPIFVADYVLEGYGTGAVMGVPAHDKRDFQFAKKFDLLIKQVIDSGLEYDHKKWQDQYADYGQLVNSGKFNGMTSKEAQEAIAADYSPVMKKVTSYKLRDWLISRQRYWGAPIPIIYDPEGAPHLVKDADLPWKLAEDVDFKPTGESPLKTSQELQERTEQYARENFADLIEKNGWDKDGKGWIPEYDTMDTFVDSSWYYLRYTDPRNEESFASVEQMKKWLPVDFYMIGPEHIVLHLLYSRFFTKFLRDQGYLDFDEPFIKMRHQGMILGPDGKKMSKSKGNVINPDEIVEKFGADTLRVYEMFMGPIDMDKPWDPNSVVGVYRFLQRIHKLVMDEGPTRPSSSSDLSTTEDKDIVRKLHQTIRKVNQDIPNLKFNTAIASMMEFVNEWETAQKQILRQSGASHSSRSTPTNSAGKQDDSTDIVSLSVLSRESVLMFVKILAPFAPFLTEELYQHLSDPKARNSKPEDGKKSLESIHLSDWPVFDPSLAKDQVVTIPVQINGKRRDEIQVESDKIKDQDFVLDLVKNSQVISKWIENKQIIKEIYVPGKIVNLVVKT